MASAWKKIKSVCAGPVSRRYEIVEACTNMFRTIAPFRPWFSTIQIIGRNRR